jgi:predicted HTH transcriptional regulator
MAKIDVPEELAPQIEEQIAAFKANAEKRQRLSEVNTEISALEQERAQLQRDLGETSTRRATPSPRSSGRKRIPAAETEAAVLDFLKSNPQSKNGDIAAHLSMKPATLSQRLAKMVESGAISKQGERSTTTYTLA